MRQRFYGRAQPPPKRRTTGTTLCPVAPTIACTADIVPPGAFEAEAGALYRRIDANGRQWTFPVLLKQTLTEMVQLQVGSNGYSVVVGDTRAQYLDDLVVGPKLHLVDQRGRLPSVAVSVEASIPTFARSGYLRTYDVLSTVYVTKDFGPVHVDYNAGMNLWRIDRPLPQGFSALAASANLIRGFGVMVEGYVFSAAKPVAPGDGGVLVALSYTARTWLVVDVGCDVGAVPGTRAYSLFAGATVIPAVLWRTGRPSERS